MIYRKTTSFLQPFLRTIIPIALLLCTILQSPDTYAQSIPTVKVEKNKKKVEKPKARKKPKKIKDRYKRPASKSSHKKSKDTYQRPKSKRKAEESKDTYRRPPSKRVLYNNTPGNENRLSSPSAEEGQPIQRLSIWQRIFNRKKPTRFAGKGKYEPSEQADGTEYVGRRKRSKIDHEQLSEERHQHRGNIRQAPPEQVEKQFGYKAEHMSFYRGNMKVLKPDREDKRLNGLSSDMQQAGLYKVKKEKDKAASYTSYNGKLKLPTLKARTRHFEKLSEKVHQYDGDIRYRKPGKDMHPSVFYLKSKTKNSYEQKEKYRRWRLVLIHIFDRQEQPKHLKEKQRKPRYDKDESEIWYY